jgi:hypothetical protein
MNPRNSRNKYVGPSICELIVGDDLCKTGHGFKWRRAKRTCNFRGEDGDCDQAIISKGVGKKRAISRLKNM